MSVSEPLHSPTRAVHLLTESVSPAVRERADSYLGASRVDFVGPTLVRGCASGSDSYQVTLSQSGDMVFVTCDCPYFTGNPSACKHIWAMMLVAAPRGFPGRLPANLTPVLVPLPEHRLHADDEDGRQAREARSAKIVRKTPVPAWELQLRRAMGSRPERKRVEAVVIQRPLAMACVIDRVASNGQVLALDLLFRETRQDGTPGAFKSMMLNRADAGQRLDRATFQLLVGIIGAGSELFNLSDAMFLSPIPNRVVLPRALAEVSLPALSAAGCLFGGTAGSKEWTPLAWDAGGAWELALYLEPAKTPPESYLLEPRLRRDSQWLGVDAIAALTSDGIVVTQSTVGAAELRGGAHLVDLTRTDGPLVVHRSDVLRFADHILKMKDLPPLVLPEFVRVPASPPVPVPCAVITKGEDRSRANSEFDAAVKFAYGERTYELGDVGSGWCDEATATVTLRNTAREKQAIDELLESGFRLSTDMNGRLSVTLPKARASEAMRALIALGWRLEADGRVFRASGAWKLSVGSGLDWFDLEGGLAFGDEIVPLPRLLAAMRDGETTVLLGDGALGMIPEEWLRRFGGLATLGKEEGERIRFTSGQVGLLDAMLAVQPEISFDARFRQARERLAQFDRISAKDEPEGFVGTLRPYQREGLGWLCFLEEFGFGGCLADDMGLGKTIQVLAYLLARKRSGPALVVCPRSLVFNWTAEAKRFAPGLRVLDHSHAERGVPGDHFDEHDLVLTTYGILRRDITQLREREFDVVILDEAQSIKNAGTEAAKAARLLNGRHRLALSGTPIENRLSELWSLFEFLNPGLLGAAKAFDSLAAAASDPQSLTAVSRAVRPYILRRTKDQVVKDLPKKLEQTLVCELEPAQRKLYDELRDHYRSALLGEVDRLGLARAKIQVLEALLRLRQAACHPGLIDKKRVSDSSAKLDTLLDQIEEVTAEDHKLLVFSQFTSMLSIVKARLTAKKIDFEYLDGKTRDREANVSRFRNDPGCRVFLISLRAGGLGLNLVEADYVFLLDPWWNPAVEAQAVDRAHRIGQTRAVFAYRLIAKDTVEEKVVQLQQQKKALADAIIRADESLIRSLTREDLELLLS